jgi:hypothetical protein
MNDRSIGCDDFRRSLRRPNRRSFLTAGVLGAAGLTLADLLRAEARDGAAVSRPNSVVILWINCP